MDVSTTTVGFGMVQFGEILTTGLYSGSYENPCIFVAYDRIVPKSKPSQLSQSPLMPGHLGQTLVSDITFYCRPDVVGSLGSRASRSNCLFCFNGSAPIVIKMYLSLQKFKMPEFKNTASSNGL